MAEAMLTTNNEIKTGREKIVLVGARVGDRFVSLDRANRLPAITKFKSASDCMVTDKPKLRRMINSSTTHAAP